jgi:hypothetical protein
VCSWTSAPPTPRWHPRTLDRLKERDENVTLLASMSRGGMGPCLAVEGPTTREVFEIYLERLLAPSLNPGQVLW